MFLDFLKIFFVKRALKRKLDNVDGTALTGTVKKVGLIIDESRFLDKEDLVKQIVDNGISESNIKILVYRDKIKKHELYSQYTFDSRKLDWKGEIGDSDIKSFIESNFDLLISYYDAEKPILLLITHKSKALFKVGFSSIDQRLNHLMIKTKVENYKVFTQELFRYLKILNKI